MPHHSPGQTSRYRRLSFAAFIGCILMSCSINRQGGSIFIPKSKSASATGASFSGTITYQLMLLDRSLVGNNGQEVQQCEALVDSAVRRIRRQYGAVDFANLDSAGAHQVLLAIDSTFTEFGFLYYTNSTLHFDVLSLAFRERFDTDYYIQFNGKNQYRKEFWKRSISRICRLIDCDLYCDIYIGIAQILQLPLQMVELPKHNYLRWQLRGRYFCWDTNDGTDVEEMAQTGYSSLRPDNCKQFLFNWSLAQMESYYTYRQGDCYWYEWKDAVRARASYHRAIQLNPRDVRANVQLVWLHIMNPQLDRELDLPQLHRMIDGAIALEENLSFLDAKACLYALQGDFDQAKKTGEQALSLKQDPWNKRAKVQKHIACFERKEVCRSLE